MPVFATFQGGEPPKAQLERWVRRWTVPAAAGLLVGARQEAKAVTARYRLSPGAVFAVPNPIDVREWTPEDRMSAHAALHLPADVPIACWHGRVAVKRKGLDILVEAWRLVCDKRSDKDLRLLLCGGGNGENRGSGRLWDLIADANLRGVHWHDEYTLDREIVLPPLWA